MKYKKQYENCSSISDGSLRSNYQSKIIVFVLLFIIVVVVLNIALIMTITVFKSTTDQKLINHRVSSSFKHRIFDRYNNILALSIESYDLYLNSHYIIDLDQTVDNLAKIFPDLNKKNARNRFSREGWFLVEKDISKKERQFVIDNGIAGAYFKRNFKRFYPYGNLFSHVVGYADIDSNGQAGLERYFDQDLYLHDINTSLDARLQLIIYNKLKSSVETYNAEGAFGAIMNINTKEVLASVSLPDFDPNLSIDPDSTNMFNRVISGSYSLGSVFKIFIAAFAIQNGVKQDTVFELPNRIRITKSKFISDEHFRGGQLTLSDIIAKSSNVGSIVLLKEFGFEKYLEFLENARVFEKIKTEISSVEISSPLYPHDEWDESDKLTAVYGYAISLSPLHFMTIASGLVDDNGMVCNPTFLLHNNVLSKCGRKYKISKYNSKHSKVLNEVIGAVVKSGTGTTARVQGYNVCGKTGTSYKLKKDSIGYDKTRKLVSFFAVFPCANPKYALYIGIDDPKRTEAAIALFKSLYKWNDPRYIDLQGGTVVAPIASQIISVILPILNEKKQKFLSFGNV